MQAKLLSKRDTNGLVEKLASTKRSNDAKILMKVKEVPHTGERGLLDAKKAVKLPRVVTMEEHIYNHMMARYGVLSLAMEHAAIFVMSLEAWAFGAPVSLDHESATKNGIGSVIRVLAHIACKCRAQSNKRRPPASNIFPYCDERGRRGVLLGAEELARIYS